jgi:type IV pilus assembly protein PilO
MAKSFHQLASRSQVIVFFLLCVLTVAGAWQVLIGPERTDLADRQARLSVVQAEVAKAKATVNRLAAVRRDVAALELALEETTAVLPDEKDPQDVLSNLHELASESSLDLANFTPKPIATKTQYAEWPIELVFEGGYHDLGRFFDRVAGMSRLISVSNLHIKTKTNPKGRGSITASCTATTFVFKKDQAPGPTGGKP